MKANLKSLEECRQLKKYERSEYWNLRKKGIQPLPWEFGCPDWSHDETGAVNCWIPPDPDAVLLDDGIPFEEQHYQAEKRIRSGTTCSTDGRRWLTRVLLMITGRITRRGIEVIA